MLNIPEDKIEEKAAYVREKLGLSNICAPDMCAVLDDLGRKTAQFSYQTALASEMGSDEAFMDEETHTLTVRETVLEAAMAGRAPARFTLAHELGHYFLGHKGTRRRNRNKSLYAGGAERIVENEADLFASYFLVPTELAWDAATSEEISQRFQVSSRAAEIAFERIRRAKRKMSGQLRQSPSVVVDFLKEAKRHGYEVRSNIPDLE